MIDEPVMVKKKEESQVKESAKHKETKEMPKEKQNPTIK